MLSASPLQFYITGLTPLKAISVTNGAKVALPQPGRIFYASGLINLRLVSLPVNPWATIFRHPACIITTAFSLIF